ncbi:MAG: protein kinase [Gammaproteobacteria bacterium]|nr:protein kinase [Gammaproteobacteria bacterium]
MTEASIQPLEIGSQLDEYRLDAVLGAGNFGLTYRATDLQLDVQVAIKEFLPKGIATRGNGSEVALVEAKHQAFFDWGMARFIAEAQILARFSHPNIVGVRRYFKANGTAYFVMTYAEGQSLSDELRERTSPFTESGLIARIVPVMYGLAEVHRKNYLHRDIKPANIYWTTDDRPVLLDFGAACAAMGEEGHQAVEVATPGYAAIEQYGNDQTLGAWTDIYALGATIYRCVKGKPPVAAPERYSARLVGKPDPYESLGASVRGDYSRRFLEVVDWMLRLSGSERPQTVSEVLQALGIRDAGTVDLVAAGKLRSDAIEAPRQQASNNYKLMLIGSVPGLAVDAVALLSEVQPLRVPINASEREATVMAYGSMSLGSEERIHLYCSGGAPRFRVLDPMLARGSLALILLLDRHSADPFADLETCFRSFPALVRENRLAIGLVGDSAPGLTERDFAQRVAGLARGEHWHPPLFDLEMESSRDLIMLIRALLFQVDPESRAGGG